jgi:hypothetical protein
MKNLPEKKNTKLLPNEYLSKIGIGSTGGVILKKYQGNLLLGFHFQPASFTFGINH